MTDLTRDTPPPLRHQALGYVRKGDNLPRIDAHAKVTGTARYAAEYSTPDICSMAWW